MFSIKSAVIIITNIFLHYVVATTKCVYNEKLQNALTGEKDYVECSNVQSMHDLAVYMRSNWHQLKVINELDSQFTIAEHINPFLQYIEHLDLSEVGTLHLSDYGFGDFSQLNQLNISNTRTLTLQDHWFSRENNVQILDISWNNLTILRREAFRRLHNLTAINLSNNEIESIETLAFSDLKRLKHLDLRNNRINYLIDWGDLLQMEVLNLDGNFLTKLPSNGFSSLSALLQLTISRNSINDLEKDCLNGLHKLQALDLSGNSIQTIPNHLFREFSHVRLLELDCSSNVISSLPSNAFENLKYLTSLDLSGNSIRNIDEYTFVGLNSLRRLLLTNNDILIMERKTFARLEKLDSLDLSGNSLETYTGDEFGITSSPKKLRKLFLRYNKLVTIEPQAFYATPNLDFLILTGNEISQLDERLLLPLTKLKKFHINRNKIEELSGLLFNTTDLLQELYMDHNRLTFFPDVSNDFNNLIKISLEGNPWQCECFKDITKWATQRDIIYSPYICKKYYDGSRPICVVTQSKVCDKDIDATNKKRIIEKYEAALNGGRTSYF